MPSIDDNVSSWGNGYEWPEDGNEWSKPWGDVDTHWHATLLPRIRHFIPAKRVLEIAPGYGRWTHFLVEHANEYIGVDLNENCIAACKKRFANLPHVQFHVNDGKSLPMVKDNSIDFAYSFDSLVHVELDVIKDYLKELSRTLSSNGVAFIHHSNLGEQPKINLSILKMLQNYSHSRSNAKKLFRKLGIIDWDHWRGPSVKAQNVSSACNELGLRCIGQEIINWGQSNNDRLYISIHQAWVHLGSSEYSDEKSRLYQ